MRCPECNKFARYEYQEPEISDLRVEADGGISGECRIVLACEEDGAELKESVLEIDVDCGEALVGHEFEIFTAEAVAGAGAEVRERHPECAADLRLQVMHLGGKSAGRNPLGQGVGLQECAVEFLGRGADNPMQADGMRGHVEE